MNEDTSNLKNNQDKSYISPEEKVESKKFTVDQDEWENYLSSKVVGKAFRLISAVVFPIIALLTYFGFNSISETKEMTQNAKVEIKAKIVEVDHLLNKSQSSINDMTFQTAQFEKFQESYKTMMNSYVQLLLSNTLSANAKIDASVADVKILQSMVNKKEEDIEKQLEQYKSLEDDYDELQNLINNTLAVNLQMIEDLSRLVDEKLVPELILIKEGDYGVSKVANIRIKYGDADSKKYVKSLQIVDLEAKRGDNEELKKYTNPIKKDTSIVFYDLDKNKYSFKINFIESGQKKKSGNYIVIEVNKVDE